MFKSTYYLILTIVMIFLFVSYSNAQFFESFDSYTAGQRLVCQNSTDWTTWSDLPCDATEDPMVSNIYSHSSPNSVLINNNNDILKLFGKKTNGTWYLSMNIYIPSGKSGYFSIFSDYNAGYLALQCNFAFNKRGQISFFANHTETNYPFQYNIWNFLQLIINLDSDIAEFWFNNNLVLSWPWSQGSVHSPGTGPLVIDAMNMWCPPPLYRMYLDNIWFHSSPLPVELSSFTVSNNELGKPVLNWITSSEINNRGFEVERKTMNGKFFTIGFVEGNGTTTEKKTYSYIDESITPGVYSYRLKQIDFDGRYEYSDEVEVEVTPPLTYSLQQNYPNPFNPETKIKFSLANAGIVKLSIYNVLGQEVSALIKENRESGFYEVNFNAEVLPSGTYIYRLEAPGFADAKKMIVIK